MGLKYRGLLHGFWSALRFRHIVLAVICVEVLFTVPGPFFAWWLPRHTDVAGEYQFRVPSLGTTAQQ